MNHPLQHCFLCLLFLLTLSVSAQTPTMYFSDTTRTGRPMAKDPHVIRFKDRYLMYYSIPPAAKANAEGSATGWGVGIAASTNLTNWRKVGEITHAPGADYEAKELCAPCALVIDGRVHLFYQTYGNWKNDAICHAISDDGLTFTRNATNPIFRPTGDWTCGRAIDAEVVRTKDRYLLFFATRDSAFKVQMQGVAAAPLQTNFNRADWTQLTDSPILAPQLPWERNCVEGASVVSRDGVLYMFYAGGYNNEPQQIGVAQSRDGVNWQRLSDKPFLPNGPPGSWNASESGHPHLFSDADGRTYLFYQGNNDGGKTWYLSKTEVNWSGNKPVLTAEGKR